MLHGYGQQAVIPQQFDAAGGGVGDDAAHERAVGVVDGHRPGFAVGTVIGDIRARPAIAAEIQRVIVVGPAAAIDPVACGEVTVLRVEGVATIAPGQLVGDFLAKRPSTAWGSVQPSYKPGVKLVNLADVLPDYAIAAIREALPVFGRKIKGYDMADAVLTGVETRTSSPLRIPRGEDHQSTNTQGLYPAGEGASYAGGILSAGVDGIKVAESLARNISS